MEILRDNLLALNPLVVVLATLAMLVVGMLWLSQPLFGRAFIRLSGIRPGDVSAAHRVKTRIVGYFTAFCAALLLGIIHQHGGQSTPLLMTCIVFIWLFIMLSQLNGFFFRREPFALFLLTTSRTLLMLLAGGAVLSMWR